MMMFPLNATLDCVLKKKNCDAVERVYLFSMKCFSWAVCRPIWPLTPREHSWCVFPQPAVFSLRKESHPHRHDSTGEATFDSSRCQSQSLQTCTTVCNTCITNTVIRRFVYTEPLPLMWWFDCLVPWCSGFLNLLVKLKEEKTHCYSAPVFF